MTPNQSDIDQGKVPATTIRELVNALRQNFAGAGADIHCIRLLLNGKGTNDLGPISVVLRAWAAVSPEQGSYHEMCLDLAERLDKIDDSLKSLELHLKTADKKASLALDDGWRERY